MGRLVPLLFAFCSGALVGLNVCAFVMIPNYSRADMVLGLVLAGILGFFAVLWVCTDDEPARTTLPKKRKVGGVDRVSG